MYGLHTRDIDTILNILKQYPQIQQVHIFGSRAQHTHQPGSDIDLAIMNKGVDLKTYNCIAAAFVESSLPYKVDLVNYTLLKEGGFKQIIQHTGCPFYPQIHPKS